MLTLASECCLAELPLDQNKTMKPPQIKNFGKLPATVRVWEMDDKTKRRIVVSIATGIGNHIKYGDVSVRVLDEQGAEIFLLQRKENITHFMDAGGTQTGIFEVRLGKKQTISRVEIRLRGVVNTFPIDEVLRPIKGPE